MDSVLQKIPELEADPSVVSCSSDKHIDSRSLAAPSAAASATDCASDSAGVYKHPPLKPSLSLSLDPNSNLFRFRDNRRCAS